ncbi:hypothetical protein DFP72DRAFT_897555 [Ephemerocybe angulata]|uniref:Uncharacterized protein n=1 Tax=Ephemerocybe angulata TaxID=980116 RepID=A0A8H6I0Q1_9AGAR|nr:hypothetical protein DFP72DRAFT_897555 [Tulosesus angulatus]
MRFSPSHFSTRHDRQAERFEAALWCGLRSLMNGASWLLFGVILTFHLSRYSSKPAFLSLTAFGDSLPAFLSSLFDCLLYTSPLLLVYSSSGT